jgi:hypothetical protein
VDVVFPDGTVIRATSLFERDDLQPPPAFGLYLDPLWDVTWPNEVINWPDRGLPVDWEEAAAQIERAFSRARRSETVEVGCRVGLGRTGTVLACMGALAGLPAENAVPWVRQHYRAASVETPDQAAWVRWFSSWISAGATR